MDPWTADEALGFAAGPQCGWLPARSDAVVPVHVLPHPATDMRPDAAGKREHSPGS